MAHANLREPANHLLFLFSPSPPPLSTDVDLPSKSYRNRFFHLPFPPDIISLSGNFISCADLFCDISPPDIMLLPGNCISFAGPFFLQRQTPDPRRRTRNRGPPLVNSHDSFNLGMPWSALSWLFYPKSAKAKAAVSVLSGGNFSCSVFIIVIKTI